MINYLKISSQSFFGKKGSKISDEDVFLLDNKKTIILKYLNTNSLNNYFGFSERGLGCGHAWETNS